MSRPLSPAAALPASAVPTANAAATRARRSSDAIAGSSPISGSDSIARRTVKSDGSPQAPIACLEALERLRDRRRFLGLVELERDLFVVADVYRHLAAADQATEQQLVGQCLADRVLDQPRHRASTHLRIEALLCQELA